MDDKEYDTWAHYAFTFRNELAKLKATAAAFSEKGCNRSGIRVQYEYGRSRVWIEYLLADGRRSVEAVSYTHLDVYKRQIIWFSLIFFLLK